MCICVRGPRGKVWGKRWYFQVVPPDNIWVTRLDGSMLGPGDVLLLRPRGAEATRNSLWLSPGLHLAEFGASRAMHSSVWGSCEMPAIELWSLYKQGIALYPWMNYPVPSICILKKIIVLKKILDAELVYQLICFLCMRHPPVWFYTPYGCPTK